MNLTKTEYRVADHLTRGLTQKEIASKLFVSPHTVRNHITNISRKIGANCSVDIARKFILSLENPKAYFASILFLIIQSVMIIGNSQGDVRIRRSRTNKTVQRWQ